MQYKSIQNYGNSKDLKYKKGLKRVGLYKEIAELFHTNKLKFKEEFDYNAISCFCDRTKHRKATHIGAEFQVKFMLILWNSIPPPLLEFSGEVVKVKITLLSYYIFRFQLSAEVILTLPILVYT